LSTGALQQPPAVIPCRALLFDMDGLMVDSEPLWLDVGRAFARARGGTWTEEMAKACIGRGLANTLRVMEGTLGIPVDLESDVTAMVELFLSRVSELRLKPGFDELLEAARSGGIPRALASSSARRLVEATLARFGLRDPFDAVVTGDCVARPKPAPDIFLEAARRLAVPPEGCVVLEDSLAGVQAARAAGMAVIAVPEHPASEEMTSLADAVVTDLGEARARLSFVVG
jgi:mannitol-1-/sugar-/sorbitol-6-/2-deoxyglucose-6-phosphatase